MDRKKKVLIHSNFSKIFTGFAKHKRGVMTYLERTGKYDLVELANGKADNDPSFEYLPWKARGTFPTDRAFVHSISQDRQALRHAHYGVFEIDRIIKEEKPDVYLGIEDVWAFSTFLDKPWWSKINTALWTTLDSLPLSEDTLIAATKTENFFVWATFAEKALKEKGLNHVKTIRGIVDGRELYEFSAEEKKIGRKRFSINEDTFIIGFVFRNQLRKSLPNLLAGFKIFKEENPTVDAKLLLHTSWTEGWNIKKQAEEKEVDMKDILTTHRCNKCGKFSIESYLGEKLDCNGCESKGSVGSVSISNGISQKELNEIYNLMDVYCHPFTSGGQEIPIQEAKLAGLITLVTDYSCGEDYSGQEVGSFPLSWHPYEEPNTEYIKASTDHQSIADQIKMVYSMSDAQKRVFINRGKKFIAELSEEKIGKQIEDWIDSLPLVDDFSFLEEEEDLVTEYVDEFAAEEDDFTWLEKTYHNIIKAKISKFDKGVKEALLELKKGTLTKDLVIERLLDITRSRKKKAENQQELSEFIDKDDKGRRIAVVLPKNTCDVYLATALLEGLKDTYPDHNIYFFTDPDHFELLNESPFIHKLIPYNVAIDKSIALEGSKDVDGEFEISFHPHWFTQSMGHFRHNGKDKTKLELNGN